MPRGRKKAVAASGSAISADRSAALLDDDEFDAPSDRMDIGTVELLTGYRPDSAVALGRQSLSESSFSEFD